jgi:hypothetical protein
LHPWLGEARLAPEHCPSLAVLGRLRCPASRYAYFYLAAWLYDAYALRQPRTAVALALADTLSHVELGPEGLGPQPDADPSGLWLRELLTELDCGSTHYPLRRPLLASHLASSPSCTLVEGFSPIFTQLGETPAETRKNFLLLVHGLFQKYCRTRPFNRDEQQERLWRLLCRFIDVPAYREQQPLRLFRVGQILARPTADECLVKWEEDEEEETIRVGPGWTPEGFGALPLQARFEAEVDLDRRTQKVRKVVTVNGLYGAEEAVTEEMVKEFMQSLNVVPPAAADPDAR